MPQQIDHVVALVRELDAAVADFAALGFTVVPGGEHAGGATHNALISFADGTYIELIAFREPDRPQGHGWWPYLAKGEGWVDFALLEPDLDAAAARLAATPIAVEGPGDGGRLRPDGARVAWRSLRPGATAGAGRLPFLIADVTPRDVRVPGGAATDHALGAARVAGATVVVTNLARARMAWGQYLGTRGMPFRGPDGEPGWRCPLGDQWLTLLAPDDSATPAGRYLQARGECLYEVALAGPGGDGASGTLLDLAATHQARLRLTP